MRAARAQCDVAICHAGGMVDVMLAAGKPLLLLPLQTEQQMTSRRVEQAACGLMVSKDMPASRIYPALKKLLDDPSYAGHACRFMSNYEQFNQDHAVPAMLKTCETLLDQSPASSQ